MSDSDARPSRHPTRMRCATRSTGSPVLAPSVAPPVRTGRCGQPLNCSDRRPRPTAGHGAVRSCSMSGPGPVPWRAWLRGAGLRLASSASMPRPRCCRWRSSERRSAHDDAGADPVEWLVRRCRVLCRCQRPPSTSWSRRSCSSWWPIAPLCSARCRRVLRPGGLLRFRHLDRRSSCRWPPTRNSTKPSMSWQLDDPEPAVAEEGRATTRRIEAGPGGTCRCRFSRHRGAPRATDLHLDARCLPAFQGGLRRA